MFDAGFWSREEVVGLLYALALSTGYVVIGYITGLIAQKKEIGSFLTIVIGGMVVRIILALAIVAYLLAVVKVHKLWFCLTFFISYFIFLMIEIFYVNYRYDALVKANRARIEHNREHVRAASH